MLPLQTDQVAALEGRMCSARMCGSMMRLTRTEMRVSARLRKDQAASAWAMYWWITGTCAGMCARFCRLPSGTL